MNLNTHISISSYANNIYLTNIQVMIPELLPSRLGPPKVSQWEPLDTADKQIVLQANTLPVLHDQQC